MNKQESADFNFIHQYNMNGISALLQLLQFKWIEAGRPMTKEAFTPEFKHFWIWFTGLTQRLNDGIMLRGDKK